MNLHLSFFTGGLLRSDTNVLNRIGSAQNGLKLLSILWHAYIKILCMHVRWEVCNHTALYIVWISLYIVHVFSLSLWILCSLVYVILCVLQKAITADFRLDYLPTTDTILTGSVDVRPHACTVSSRKHASFKQTPSHLLTSMLLCIPIGIFSAPCKRPALSVFWECLVSFCVVDWVPKRHSLSSPGLKRFPVTSL